jgi:hypothetical protein
MTEIINRIGLGTFGVISICLFITVFTTAMIWGLCQKKAFLKRMETLPLEDERQPFNQENP